MIVLTIKLVLLVHAIQFQEGARLSGNQIAAGIMCVKEMKSLVLQTVDHIVRALFFDTTSIQGVLHTLLIIASVVTRS